MLGLFMLFLCCVEATTWQYYGYYQKSLLFYPFIFYVRTVMSLSFEISFQMQFQK